jgi:hypothetical protein
LCSASDVCTECKEGFYFNSKSERCESDCGNGYFENKLAKRCTLCDRSKVTTCVDYKTKAVSCTDLHHGRNLLNTVTNECVNACPAGTWKNCDVCKPCGKLVCDSVGVASGECKEESNCDTCLEDEKCLTCKAGYLFIEETYKCV